MADPPVGLAIFGRFDSCLTIDLLFQPIGPRTSGDGAHGGLVDGLPQRDQDQEGLFYTDTELFKDSTIRHNFRLWHHDRIIVPKAILLEIFPRATTCPQQDTGDLT